MDLKALEAFVAVAEELHFGRAAERLHLSQPPLSNRIRQLESELRIQLFVRNTRSVSLTDEGARLLTAARRVLNEVEATRELADAISSGEEGRVRIGFAGASSQRALPVLASAVRAAHPRIELALQSQTYVFTALEMLLDGSLDLAFARLPIAHDELAYRVVEVEELLCALPTSHPLTATREVRVADLVHEDFISLSEDQGSILQSTMMSLCASAGFRPRITQVAPDSNTVLALVAAGAGVTITLSSVRRVQTVGIAYRPLIDARPRHMLAVLAWRKDNPSPALRHVLEVSLTALRGPDLSVVDMRDRHFSIGNE